MIRLALVPLVLLSLTRMAIGSDGIVEINQACATSVAGCFPGDAGGFPVTIVAPGSYRVTSNLSVPLNTTAIQINANLVTLDLGGFVVSGLNACPGYPTTSCTVTRGNPGITSAQFLVVVRNGSVTGMGGIGISLTGPSSEVDSVRLLGSGDDGISAQGAVRITHCFSGGNFGDGIDIGEGVTADDNEVRANKGYGIFVYDFRLSSSVTRNRAYDNTDNGVYANDGITLVSRNVASANGGAQVLGGVSLGDNLCTGTRC
jgi:parallel beta helix pectate lyase-like protein